LEINGLKLSHSQSHIKDNKNDKGINEIVLSVQNMQSNVDVQIVANITNSMKGNIFQDFV
jgi:hypothetical protein